METEKIIIVMNNYKEPIVPKDYMSRHNKRWRILSNTNVTVTFEEISDVIERLSNLLSIRILEHLEDDVLVEYLRNLVTTLYTLNMEIVFYLKYNKFLHIDADNLELIVKVYIMTDLFNFNYDKWYILILKSKNELVIEKMEHVNLMLISWFTSLTKGCRKAKFITQRKLIFN